MLCRITFKSNVCYIPIRMLRTQCIIYIPTHTHTHITYFGITVEVLEEKNLAGREDDAVVKLYLHLTWDRWVH